MATTVESVDNLRQPPPNERLNPVDRSSAEDQRRRFKKALQEEMAEEKDKEKGRGQADAVTIGEDRKGSDQSDHDGHQVQPQQPDDRETEDQRKHKTPPEKRVDLKA